MACAFKITLERIYKTPLPGHKIHRNDATLRDRPLLDLASLRLHIGSETRREHDERRHPGVVNQLLHGPIRILTSLGSHPSTRSRPHDASWNPNESPLSPHPVHWIRRHRPVLGDLPDLDRHHQLCRHQVISEYEQRESGIGDFGSLHRGVGSCLVYEGRLQVLLVLWRQECRRSHRTTTPIDIRRIRRRLHPPTSILSSSN